jgi:type VI protein secretion system component Hcp
MSRARFAALFGKHRARLGLLLVVALAATVAISFVRPARPAAGADPEVPTFVSVTAQASQQGEIRFTARDYEFTGLSDKAAEKPPKDGDREGRGHDYSPFMVEKDADSSDSPMLARAFVNDEALPSVEIRVVSNVGTPLLAYTLKNAWIAVYRHSGDFPGSIRESIGFGFKTIDYDVDFSLGGPLLTDRALHIFDTRERNDRP